MPLKSVALLDSTMISHRWALVKQIALDLIRFPLQFIELEDLDSHMNQVHTHQLSAHQQL